MEEKKYIHIYTGDGKGKTTAAMGLALRFFGNGGKVYIAHFLKFKKSSETLGFEKIDSLEKYRIKIDYFGTKKYKKYKDKLHLFRKTDFGIDLALKRMLSGDYGLIILDEILMAISLDIIKLKTVLDFIKKKPDNVELVLTGRNCPKEIIEKADLVTEMKEIKHYYNNGILARKGIEL